jgi:hypothetical protein
MDSTTPQSRIGAHLARIAKALRPEDLSRWVLALEHADESGTIKLPPDHSTPATTVSELAGLVGATERAMRDTVGRWLGSGCVRRDIGPIRGGRGALYVLELPGVFTALSDTLGTVGNSACANCAGQSRLC